MTKGSVTVLDSPTVVASRPPELGIHVHGLEATPSPARLAERFGKLLPSRQLCSVVATGTVVAVGVSGSPSARLGRGLVRRPHRQPRRRASRSVDRGSWPSGVTTGCRVPAPRSRASEPKATDHKFATAPLNIWTMPGERRPRRCGASSAATGSPSPGRPSATGPRCCCPTASGRSSAGSTATTWRTGSRSPRSRRRTRPPRPPRRRPRRPPAVSMAPCPDGSATESGLDVLGRPPLPLGVCGVPRSSRRTAATTPHGEHGDGRAIDFMISDPSLGQAVADFGPGQRLGARASTTSSGSSRSGRRSARARAGATWPTAAQRRPTTTTTCTSPSTDAACTRAAGRQGRPGGRRGCAARAGRAGRRLRRRREDRGVGRRGRRRVGSASAMADSLWPVVEAPGSASCVLDGEERRGRLAGRGLVVLLRAVGRSVPADLADGRAAAPVGAAASSATRSDPPTSSKAVMVTTDTANNPPARTQDPLPRQSREPLAPRRTDGLLGDGVQVVQVPLGLAQPLVGVREVGLRRLGLAAVPAGPRTSACAMPTLRMAAVCASATRRRLSARPWV